MAQTIKLKRSASTGNVPTAAQIDLGELAINTTDGRVYMKKGDNSILTLNPHALSEITKGNPSVRDYKNSSCTGLQNGILLLEIMESNLSVWDCKGESFCARLHKRILRD